jgi:hypothetical protein
MEKLLYIIFFLLFCIQLIAVISEKEKQQKKELIRQEYEELGGNLMECPVCLESFPTDEFVHCSEGFYCLFYFILHFY